MINFKIESIGTIDRGIDGKDHYLLVSSNEPLTRDEVLDEFQVYKYTSRYPGDWFCDCISFVWETVEGYSAIVTIHHRLDI